MKKILSILMISLLLLVSLLCKYFEESKNHIVDYLELMNKKQLKMILEMYGVEPKKVRKYIK
tara:strand:- start:139 stop:324 length:186 start_codon:yes stop_codon:yes gene_type:complete